MNRQLKEKWVVALRSGMYTQIKGSFSVTAESKKVIPSHENLKKGFCCLGVLMEITKNENNVPSNDYDLGIELGRHSKILIKMNDIEEKSFSEIADYIEKNLHEA